ncbi:MAG: hypothetical protein JWO58_536 [Chitinophagaceae bacterium]|nr:hypothetical protein [Chitinophagaceae bacterium]
MKRVNLQISKGLHWYVSYRFKILFYLFFTLFPSCLKAQFYSAGVDPASVHWEQVEEDRIRVIFPKGYETQALSVLEKLKEIKKEAVQTIPTKVPPISVILHNQTAESNGFVVWAPKRVEFFTLADQNIYPQDWLNQLATHEFRHVVQISNLRQGLTKVLSVIAGEQAIGAVLGLYIPTWFLEGDAVSFETSYTHTGRGRTPAFFIPYISMLNKYGGFFYEKAVFGSYKHFIPDHYVVGYHLVSYSRFYFGERIWKSVLDRVARRPYSITPFSNGLKRATGMTKFKWYNWSAKQIDAMYREPLVSVKNISHSFSGKKTLPDFVSYRFPHYLNDSMVVVEKTGLSFVPQWVLINRQGKEQRIIYPGYYSLANTSLSKGKLYYTEYKFDKRWTHRLWSDVKELDLATKKKRRVTFKTYAASPSASIFNDNQIAYVEQNKKNEFWIVTKDLSTDHFNRFQSDHDQMLFTPVWSSDSSIVCIALDKERGKYFARLNMKDSSWSMLSPPLFYDINQPLTWNQYIIHRGAYESTEQIYAYDTIEHKTYRVTQEPYEATDPAITDDKLVFSSYTATGYELKEQLLHPSDWIEFPIQGVQWDNAVTQIMTLQESKVITKEDSSQTLDYTIRKYRKITHLFNFHSWAPLYIDVNNATVNSGASAFSQNLLSTSFLSAGYLYDNTEQTGKWILNYQYTGLYPALSFSTTLGDRYMKRYGNWKEFVFNAAIALPFNLTHGPYTEKLTLTASPQFQSIYNVEEHNSGGLVNQNLLSVLYRLEYSRLFRLSTRDLRSSKGQSFFIQYRNAPVADFSYSAFWAASFQSYLPSVWRHHSILAIVQGHHYNGGGLYLSSPIAFPRGYTYQFAENLIRGSIDYTFPICYPDWRLTALLYIKRIKANIFYDGAFAAGNNTIQSLFYDSKGIDIRMDCHVANFLSPIDIGIRFYQLNNGNFINYQLLLAYQLGK